ncbi:hypothetical protein PVAND_017023 [Polypedilum vanderplanki]|uniref:Uncharacterized protein n=1 Tax=Polypedilum vanderplanki TaxID=319348 RepID=A0A9J6BHT2_POLVA|nr:hypothetical protein PVAND_017023 [Polypedilum vanderplanki]
MKILLIFLLAVKLVVTQPLNNALNTEYTSEEITPSLIRELILAVLKLTATFQLDDEKYQFDTLVNEEEKPINGKGRRFLGGSYWYPLYPRYYPQWYPYYY